MLLVKLTHAIPRILLLPSLLIPSLLLGLLLTTGLTSCNQGKKADTRRPNQPAAQKSSPPPALSLPELNVQRPR